MPTCFIARDPFLDFEADPEHPYACKGKLYRIRIGGMVQLRGSRIPILRSAIFHLCDFHLPTATMNFFLDMEALREVSQQNGGEDYEGLAPPIYTARTYRKYLASKNQERK